MPAVPAVLASARAFARRGEFSPLCLPNMAVALGISTGGLLLLFALREMRLYVRAALRAFLAICARVAPKRGLNAERNVSCASCPGPAALGQLPCASCTVLAASCPGMLFDALTTRLRSTQLS